MSTQGEMHTPITSRSFRMFTFVTSSGCQSPRQKCPVSSAKKSDFSTKHPRPSELVLLGVFFCWRLRYTPSKTKHGTWKSPLWKGKTSSKASFLGFHVKFRGVEVVFLLSTFWSHLWTQRWSVNQVFCLNTSVWSIGAWWISPCRANLGIPYEVPLLGEKNIKEVGMVCSSNQDHPVKSSEFRTTSTQGSQPDFEDQVVNTWGWGWWCWFRLWLPGFHLVIFMWTSHSFSGVYMLAMLHCTWGAWYSV